MLLKNILFLAFVLICSLREIVSRVSEDERKFSKIISQIPLRRLMERRMNRESPNDYNMNSKDGIKFLPNYSLLLSLTKNRNQNFREDFKDFRFKKDDHDFLDI